MYSCFLVLWRFPTIEKILIERAIGYAFRLMTIKMSHSSGRVEIRISHYFCCMYDNRLLRLENRLSLQELFLLKLKNYFSRL